MTVSEPPDGSARDVALNVEAKVAVPAIVTAPSVGAVESETVQTAPLETTRPPQRAPEEGMASVPASTVVIPV